MTEKTEKVKQRSKERVAAVKKQLRVAASKLNGKPAPSTVSSNRLELLITIVSRSKAEYYLDLIQSFNVNMQTSVLAHGTADAKTMSLLGLTDNEKTVIFSVIQQNKIPDAMHALDLKFKTIKDGKGVACTVPLTSVIGKLIYGFLSNNEEFRESK